MEAGRFSTGSGKFVASVSHAAATKQTPPTLSLVKDVTAKKAKSIEETMGADVKVTRLTGREDTGFGVEDVLTSPPPTEDNPADDIPPVPENPDKRPQLMQMAEEYFGKLWMVTLVIVALALFHYIKKIRL